MTDTPTLPDLAAVVDAAREPIVASTRIDGWTGAHQRRFLEAIADEETVRDACGLVRLSPQSAYAFHRRPRGRAFDLGWKAADLLAREKVAADLLARATESQTVEITRADGSTVTKHHYDNRLAVQMLARLDRYADAGEGSAPGHAARLVAGDFDAYLELLGAEGGPARAGLFMMHHAEAPSAALEPLVALARADRQIRCGTLATDAADLDPAARADWTAGQWARAEACGLVVLAPAAPQPADAASTCQPASTSPRDPLDEHVWLDRQNRQWRTDFPPPEDFMGEETADWDEADYERELTEEEMAQLGLPEPGSEAERVEREAERDAWFAANAWPAAAAADATATPAPPRTEHPAPPPVDPAPDTGPDTGRARGDFHGLQEA